MDRSRPSHPDTEPGLRTLGARCGSGMPGVRVALGTPGAELVCGTADVRLSFGTAAAGRGLRAGRTAAAEDGLKPGTARLGLGARAGVDAAELAVAIDSALRRAGLDATAVTALATLDRRAAEAGVRAVAGRYGWLLRAFTAAQLAGAGAPNPSGQVAAATGTPSVAEAAALLAAGPGAVLVLSKQVFPRVTVAVARMH